MGFFTDFLSKLLNKDKQKLLNPGQESELSNTSKTEDFKELLQVKLTDEEKFKRYLKEEIGINDKFINNNYIYQSIKDIVHEYRNIDIDYERFKENYSTKTFESEKDGEKKCAIFYNSVGAAIGTIIISDKEFSVTKINIQDRDNNWRMNPSIMMGYNVVEIGKIIERHNKGEQFNDVGNYEAKYSKITKIYDSETLIETERHITKITERLGVSREKKETKFADLVRGKENLGLIKYLNNGKKSKIFGFKSNSKSDIATLDGIINEEYGHIYYDNVEDLYRMKELLIKSKNLDQYSEQERDELNSLSEERQAITEELIKKSEYKKNFYKYPQYTHMQEEQEVELR